MAQITNIKKSSLPNLINQPILPIQNILFNNNNNLSMNLNNHLQKLNISNINSIDNNKAQKLIKIPLKISTGLNFNKFKSLSLSQNTCNFRNQFLYFLSHNKNSIFEDKKPDEQNLENNFLPKNESENFEEISNIFLGQEIDFYKEFEEQFGKIRAKKIKNYKIKNKLNIINKKENKNQSIDYNYIPESSILDFNNSKIGIYLLMQQNGKNNKNSKCTKRCIGHQRRKQMKKKIF